MKFRYGSLPEASQFSPAAEGWRATRNLHPGRQQMLAIPVAVVLLLLIWFTLILLSPLGLYPPNLWIAGLIVVFVTSAHELIHALFSPGLGQTDRTIIGIWSARLMLYSFYDGPVSRNRYLGIIIGPFFILTVLPLVLVALLSPLHVDRQIIAGLGFLAFMNGGISCSDFVTLAWMLFQVPPSATVRTHGWRIFWKLGALNRSATEA